MDRRVNLLKVAAFLLSTLISAGIFGGFAVWAVSTLDPAAQETIGLVSSPWFGASAQQKPLPMKRDSALSSDAYHNGSPPALARRP